MRKVDSINGEIGQLKYRVRELESRINKLEIERAESEAAEAGLLLGQTVEAPYGGGQITGIITGFSCGFGSRVVVRRILKGNKLGAEINVSSYDWPKVKVIEDAPKDPIDTRAAQ